jgi:hypothetical protein
MSLKRRAIALRPSISGSNAVPFVIRERCLLERRSTGARSADELGAASIASFGGSVARHIAPDLPGMRADPVMNVSLFSGVSVLSRSATSGDRQTTRTTRDWSMAMIPPQTHARSTASFLRLLLLAEPARALARLLRLRATGQGGGEGIAFSLLPCLACSAFRIIFTAGQALPAMSGEFSGDDYELPVV